MKKISLTLVFALCVVFLAGTALAQNSPPVADAGPYQTIYLGDAAALHGTATDPDGDPIAGWQWEVISAPAGEYVHSLLRRHP